MHPPSRADPTAAQDPAAWADTDKAVVGEPLAFIDADETWSEPAVRNLVPLSKALKARHVPLGVVFDADLSGNGSDESWSRNTLSHVATVEQALGVHPDHADITTWVRHPSRVLPETDPMRVSG